MFYLPGMTAIPSYYSVDQDSVMPSPAGEDLQDQRLASIEVELPIYFQDHRSRLSIDPPNSSDPQ